MVMKKVGITLVARDRSFTVACIHNIYHCLLVTVDYYTASLVQGLPMLQGG